MENIRNFVIIAHVDHGKSTLADRFLEITGTVEKRLMKSQYLDQLESERERGITIKMAPVRMIYQPSETQNISDFGARVSILSNSKQELVLNLIDTPGHSDFSYEVSRALAAVEGAVLLVDVTQGIQAQTLANFEKAKKQGLKILGVVTKTDLNTSQIDKTIQSLADLLNVSSGEILRVSGKTGEGVDGLLKAIINQIPPPKGSDTLISKALIFDSWYDEHKGIVASVRIFSGEFHAGDSVHFIASNSNIKIKEVGCFHPQLKPAQKLSAGEIGYIATGIKDPNKIKIGDTIIRNYKFKIENCLPLAGYKEPQPVVFVSFYPEDNDRYDDLKYALAKLKLNDSSLFSEPDNSELLGRGFKGGFLGQLHFEITAERLEKEFKINTVQSFPSVAYQVKTKNNLIEIKNPKDFPDEFVEALEPMTKIEIISPPQYLGNILSLKQIFRLSNFETKNLGQRMLITAKLPLADIISDFDDKLRSISEGYASFSYEVIGYEKSNLEKLDILIADHLASGLTRILPKEKVNKEARATVEKLKKILPRQQFAQAVQAAVRGQIIARETVPAIKKDVTGHLYGGDRTRKMKLWKKQQKGKVKLKELAQKTQVKIPASVFKELLKK